MNIILFGPPGAGKGTQSDYLKKDFNLFKISTGDLLREEIKKRSNLGKKIKNIIKKGSFVSDEIINELIESIISNNTYFNRLIFDGYPRNLNQAENLKKLFKKYNQKILYAFNLDVPEDIIIKRISGRQTCAKCGLIFNVFFNPPKSENHKCDSKYLSKRSDDNEKTVRNRYKTYLKETLPILDFYKKEKILHKIDGTEDILRIYEQIKRIIGSLET